MKRKWVLFLVTISVFLTCFAGCDNKPGSSGGGSGGNKVTGELAFPEITGFTGDKVTILASSLTVSDKTAQLLKNEYGLTAEVIQASDPQARLTAMILSDEAPDLMKVGRGTLDLVTYNIVQPLDGYIDLTHPFYKDLLTAYDATEWAGSHYSLVTGITRNAGMLYNRKLFEDAGLENPWEQYKADTWDWEAFRDAAKEITVDENNDNEPDTYGFAFYRPQVWPYTTGVPFSTFDGKNLKITNNLDNADISRAMNFIYDMLAVDGTGMANYKDVLDKFGNGKVGMMIFDANIIGMPEVQKLAEKGEVGMAPLPRDPKADKYYSYTTIQADIIPVGAKNPKGAIAYNAVERYLALSPEEKQAEIDSRKKDMHFDEEMEEQYQAMHLQEGTVYPVIDQMDGVGYNATWFCIYSPLPWSTVVEAQMPLAEAYVQRMLMAKEIDKPTGPKNLELFEVYSTGTDKPLSTEFFPLISGANPNLEIYLDTDNAHQGNYAAKVCYVIDKADKVQWTGFSKELGITWATNDTLTFWAKGDGTLQKMTIKVQDSQMEWTYTMNIEGGDGKAYEIPLSEFSPPDWWEGDAAMDLSKIDSIAFQLEASGEHFVYMDDIRVIAKNG